MDKGVDYSTVSDSASYKTAVHAGIDMYSLRLNGYCVDKQMARNIQSTLQCTNKDLTFRLQCRAPLKIIILVVAPVGGFILLVSLILLISVCARDGAASIIRFKILLFKRNKPRSHQPAELW